MLGCKTVLPIRIESDNKSQEELLDHLSKEKDDTQAIQALTNHRLEKLKQLKTILKSTRKNVTIDFLSTLLL